MIALDVRKVVSNAEGISTIMCLSVMETAGKFLQEKKISYMMEKKIIVLNALKVYSERVRMNE